MQVRVQYADGSEETFTSVTAYTNNGSAVRLTGTDAGGISGEYELNWALIRRITKVGTTG
jgi:hypothetical protein